MTTLFNQFNETTEFYLGFVFLYLSSFRVLGLKVIPLLIKVIYCSSFLFIYTFIFNIYSEEYFMDYLLLLNWLITSSSIFYSFFFISAGSTATLVSLKVYLSPSMIVANFIDLYLFGLLAVLINSFFIVFYFGWLLSSFLFYLFLHRFQIFLFLLSFLESFSSLFQSLTLSNRLSINLLSGSLLIHLLSISLRLFSWILFFFLLIFYFETLNSQLQLLIFSLLFISFLA